MMQFGFAGDTGTAPKGSDEQDTAAVFSGDRYFEMQALLDRMSSEELARFRSAPENQAILRQFDQFASRQALPYMLSLVVLMVVSMTVGLLLVL